jgi:hypothetical protein
MIFLVYKYDWDLCDLLSYHSLVYICEGMGFPSCIFVRMLFLRGKNLIYQGYYNFKVMVPNSTNECVQRIFHPSQMIRRDLHKQRASSHA